MSLKHLDISNCGSLRDLQLRMLERPLAELEAARTSSKVRIFFCHAPPPLSELCISGSPVHAIAFPAHLSG